MIDRDALSPLGHMLWILCAILTVDALAGFLSGICFTASSIEWVIGTKAAVARRLILLAMAERFRSFGCNNQTRSQAADHRRSGTSEHLKELLHPTK